MLQPSISMFVIPCSAISPLTGTWDIFIGREQHKYWSCKTFCTSKGYDTRNDFIGSKWVRQRNQVGNDSTSEHTHARAHVFILHYCTVLTCRVRLFTFPSFMMSSFPFLAGCDNGDRRSRGRGQNTAEETVGGHWDTCTFSPRRQIPHIPLLPPTLLYEGEGLTLHWNRRSDL